MPGARCARSPRATKTRGSHQSFSRDNPHCPRDVLALTSCRLCKSEFGKLEFARVRQLARRGWVERNSVGAVGEFPTEPALTRSMPN